jgi:hypothetical protein
VKDTDPEQGSEARERPAWVDKQAGHDPGMPPKRRRRPERKPVPGTHADDGLWEHVLEIGALVVLSAWIAAVVIPHDVSVWWATVLGGFVTVITGYVSLTLTASPAVALYLTVWGIGLTGWFTAARLISPWRGGVMFCLGLFAAVMMPLGVTVIRKHRDRIKRGADLGRDNANVRECRHWHELLTRYGVKGHQIRDVIRVDGGYQVHGRLGKFNEGGEKPTTMHAILELSTLITQHKRLPKGAVYVEDQPSGGSAADFIIHVTTETGPKLSRYLPAENKLLSINSKFPLGVLSTGREFMLKLREVVVFICGVRGSGKSTLLNIFVAQLARMPDVLIFMIDLKGGQEAHAWLMPWLKGETDRPVIDWLATTRQEADVMLDALWRGGQARAEAGGHGRKLRPDHDHPAILVICDEQAVLTGHFIREDNLSSAQLATKLLRISETFRSVAIDPVIAAVRAVVDVTGNSGIKAMSEVRIGMKVATADEGRAIFPDHNAAAKQLAQLTDKGMGIPKVGAELSPPVHFYNITDGELDDDGRPTEDRITPIATACGAAERRARPEQLLVDAMGEAYTGRWHTEHMKQLTDGWLQTAGNRPPPPPPGSLPVQDTPDEDFAKIAHLDFHADGMDAMMDDGNEGRRLNPARKRMRQLLIGRGHEGWKADQLWRALQAEGLTVARQTLHSWLAEDEQRGYVYRTGKPRSRWVWRLAEGAEFDIPGMD